MSLIKIIFKKASLKSDMVTRVMHSALIGAVPKNQYTLTEGIIDELLDDSDKKIEMSKIYNIGEDKSTYIDFYYKIIQNYNSIISILNGFENKSKSSEIKRKIRSIRSYKGYITEPLDFYKETEYGEEVLDKNSFNLLWTKAMDEISKLKFMILELFI